VSLPSIPLLRAGGFLRQIPVAAIRVARHNPRTDAEARIGGLAASLSAGLVQFPTVVAVGDDEYELIDGERRWRGAQAAGLDTLLCLVREAGTPSATLFTQLLANLHRQDLGPLDESAALKVAWLVLNAQAMHLGDQADTLLGNAAQLRDALEPLRTLLEGAGWSWREPPVSQAVFIERLGLAMSAAVLKKKLQVLGATEAIQETARQHSLTAAAIRALMTLEPEHQATLLAVIETDPPLAKAVRSIVQGVKQKGRSIEEAISIVQGRDTPDDPWPPAAGGAGLPAATARVTADRGEEGDAVETPPARPAISDDAAMDAVLPLIELAQDLQGNVTRLRCLAAALDELPAPWGDYASEAMRLITTTIQPYTS